MRMVSLSKGTLILLLLFGVMLIYHEKWLIINFKIHINSSFNQFKIYLRNISFDWNTDSSLDQRGIFERIIVPRLINPRKSIDHSLQQLINISLRKFESCPDGRYSRYLRVLIQREWETNVTAEEPKNASNIPLIIYGTTNALFRTLNSSGCRYMCEYSTNESDYERATLAVYTKHWGKKFIELSDNKIWAYETNESPIHISMPKKSVENKFSIFVTYATDSLVPWVYGMFLPFDKPYCLISQTTRELMANEDSRRFLPAHHPLRTKLAAWVVSNRFAENREDKFYELNRFIEIDRYGKGAIPCGREQDQTCFENLSRIYKFLITFENSNCHEYITEKLFKNALRHDMVPIVFGAPSDDYYELAPPNSYIDESSFVSIDKLVNYLLWLDTNDTAYASYFAWKKYGYLAKKSKIDCRLCGVLHNTLNGNLDFQKDEFHRFTDNTSLCLLQAT